MAKPKPLQAQVMAVAKAIDREPLMSALANALRKVPRRPSHVPDAPLRQAPHSAAEARAAAAQPKRRARASRVGFRRYEIINNPRFRRGTWRAFMIDTICACEDTREATTKHRESGEYPDSRLDFNWCVKQGYIAYKT